MEHDAAGQPGYVSQACFCGADDCNDEQCACVCHDEGDVSNEGSSMDFGQALAALKGGGKVSRQGWNGKGMFVVHQKGYPDGIAINKNTAEATGVPEGTVCAFRPYLMMRTVDGEFVPWVASQSDLLAEDWAAV